MTIEIKRIDASSWGLAVDGRIVSNGLSLSEAQRLASEWQGEKPWIASWRFAPQGS